MVGQLHRSVFSTIQHWWLKNIYKKPEQTRLCARNQIKPTDSVLSEAHKWFWGGGSCPHPIVERPLLVTHVCTHTHSPMHTLFSFPPPSFLIQGQIFPDAHYFSPLLIQQGEGSTVSFKGSLSAAFPPHSRHGNSGACVLEHVCTETQDVVGYCMLAQPALQTLGLEFFWNSRVQRRSRGYGVPSTSQTPGTSVFCEFLRQFAVREEI